jgi:hypothetical protein
MAIETINLGTYANDGQGDDLRVAFQKVNSNFTQLDNIVAVNGINLGTGAPVFNSKVTDPGIGDLLSFRSIKAGPNISVSSDSTSITISGVDSINALSEDTQPELGNNLDLNSNDIVGSGNIDITGNIDVTGTITANSFVGNLEGHADYVVNGVYTVGDQTIGGIKTFAQTIQGNLNGNAATVTNGVYTTSSINALIDVDTNTQPPVPGQALVWSGTSWVPGNISAGQPSGSLDFGSFTSPSGTNLDMGPIV